uniref:Uncharacterized protein n=1 Tax=Arundo donax TaxID=35708 RepID=A0A0A9AZJ6_ARUDO
MVTSEHSHNTINLVELVIKEKF